MSPQHCTSTIRHITLLSSEISFSAHSCLILTSKNYSPGVLSSWILIWQQLCSVNSFSKNSFHLLWQFTDSISERSVDKGCGCPGKTCLSPAGGDKDLWNVAKGHRPQGKVKQPSTVLFLQVLSFSIFTLASAFLLPTTHPPAPAMSFGERLNDAS